MKHIALSGARRALPLVASTLALLGLSACVMVPAHRPYYGGGVSVGVGAPVYAPIAPPAPQVEVVPALPYPGAIWIGGYWSWSSGRHVWVPGRYEAPRRGYYHEPQRWEPSARGGYELRGGWRER